MPKTWIRLFVSIVLVMHFSLTIIATLAHRGNSRLLDDVQSKVGVYPTFTDARMDINILPAATRVQLQETVWIQWHAVGQPIEEWHRWPQRESEAKSIWPVSAMEVDRQRRWLRQMVELLEIGNEDAVSQMLIALMNAMHQSSDKLSDNPDKTSRSGAVIVPDQVRE